MAIGPTKHVVVHSFICFDEDIGDRVVPPFKATPAAIAERFAGKVLPLTAEHVDPAEIDEEGRWYRLASGWGQLN